MYISKNVEKRLPLYNSESIFCISIAGTALLSELHANNFNLKVPLNK